MELKQKGTTHLHLEGFSLNPIFNRNALLSFIVGLASYSEIHSCDFIEEMVHLNNLGKPYIDEISPFALKIENESKNEFFCLQIIDNGYFTLRVLKDEYPSRIIFDLFIEEKIKEFDLVIDHFCAPALNSEEFTDGFGLFDYDYRISYYTQTKSSISLIKENSLEHINKKESYLDPFDLNSINSLSCYFCKNTATNWVIAAAYKSPHVKLNFENKSIPVCKKHISEGRTEEDRNLEYDKEIPF